MPDQTARHGSPADELSSGSGLSAKAAGRSDPTRGQRRKPVNSQVCSRLPAGGSEIRTLGPSLARAFTRSKTSMSGPVGVGGFEEGEFEGDGPLEKVAAQILL